MRIRMRSGRQDPDVGGRFDSRLTYTTTVRVIDRISRGRLRPPCRSFYRTDCRVLTCGCHSRLQVQLAEGYCDRY